MRITFILAVLLLSACGDRSAEAPTKPIEAQAAPAGTVDRSHSGDAAPDVAFLDPDGGETVLADFQGAPLLLNLWASWCAPCVKELPTLDRLAQKQGDELQVLALSQDSGPQPSVAAFLEKNGITTLASYQDLEMGMSDRTGAATLPTTILYDARGHEVWRVVGDMDWTGPEAARLLAEAATK